MDVVVERDGYKPTQGISMRMMWGVRLLVHEPGAPHDGEMRRRVSKEHDKKEKKKKKMEETYHRPCTGSGGEVDDHLALG